MLEKQRRDVRFVPRWFPKKPVLVSATYIVQTVVAEKKNFTMNKEAVKQGFSGCFDTYRTEAVVQHDIAHRLATMLDAHLAVEPQRAVEVGCGSGFLSEQLLTRFPHAAWLHNDIAPSAKCHIEAAALKCNASNATFVVGDAEAMELPQGFDLFVSSSAVQWFADIDGFLQRLSNAMSDGGTVAISTFGPQNLVEVRTLTGNGLAYLSLAEFVGVVGRYFDVVASSEQCTSLFFVEPVEVLRHIKQTGVNGSFRQCWTKGRLAEFSQSYSQFRTSKGYALTYHPLYVVARKKKLEEGK